MRKSSITIGAKYGRLKTVKDLGPRSFSNQIHQAVECVCDCGNRVVARRASIASGKTKSCGCLQRDTAASVLRSAILKHGHAIAGNPSRTYKSWLCMIQRCTNKSCRDYHNYGGRGIRVCKRWLRFESFLHDMGECPHGLTIERISNGGIYEKRNCKWDTRRNQNRNKRNNRVLTVRCITGCLAELCDRFDTKYSRVKSRLSRGWSPERAFFDRKFSRRSKRP